jgi:transposase-like protein
MSRSTISTFQLFEKFPDEESAHAYLESRLWKGGAVCPKCKSKAGIAPRKGKPGFHFCNPCRLDFTVRTGTVFGRSHIPLHKWLYAMYLLATARKGISSMQLAKEIGITQKSAWLLLQRLRGACGGQTGMLSGTVEADETHIGGLEGNRHMYDRVRGRKEKAVVFGMRQRGGDTVAMVVENTGGERLRAAIQANVAPGSRVMTDECAGYAVLEKMGFERGSVKHAVEEFVRGDVHTNGIDSVWAVMKGGLHGVYHHASRKRLGRYVDEFAFRLNAGKVQRHTWKRLDSLVDAMAGKRITYETLTAGFSNLSIREKD